MTLKKYEGKPSCPFFYYCNGKNPNLCPVQAIHEYIQLFKPIQGALFQFLGNSPVTDSFMSSKLHMLLQFIGLDPKCYKGHSFRIGAATNVVNMGFSVQYIRKLGRWNSNAIQNILEYPPSTYKRAPCLPYSMLTCGELIILPYIIASMYFHIYTICTKFDLVLSEVRFCLLILGLL